MTYERRKQKLIYSDFLLYTYHISIRFKEREREKKRLLDQESMNGCTFKPKMKWDLVQEKRMSKLKDLSTETKNSDKEQLTRYERDKLARDKRYEEKELTKCKYYFYTIKVTSSSMKRLRFIVSRNESELAFKCCPFMKIRDVLIIFIMRKNRIMYYTRAECSSVHTNCLCKEKIIADLPLVRNLLLIDGTTMVFIRHFQTEPCFEFQHSPHCYNS